MKSVMLSIQPKWCELIASGEKTVEVRKTKSKLNTPFKCYIYCTQGKFKPSECLRNNLHYDDSTIKVCEGQGKVIGEFVCDRISVIDAKNLRDYCEGCEAAFIDDLAPCDYSLEKIPEIGLSSYELSLYVGDKNGYEWHISDLVIYDKPKELNEFSKYGFVRPVPLKRPPQSWCYVEVS